MFQDVPNLISIEMVSEKNAKIISMISTFENCKYLEKFYSFNKKINIKKII